MEKKTNKNEVVGDDLKNDSELDVLPTEDEVHKEIIDLEHYADPTPQSAPSLKTTAIAVAKNGFAASKIAFDVNFYSQLTTFVTYAIVEYKLGDDEVQTLLKAVADFASERLGSTTLDTLNGITVPNDIRFLLPLATSIALLKLGKFGIDQFRAFRNQGKIRFNESDTLIIKQPSGNATKCTSLKKGLGHVAEFLFYNQPFAITQLLTFAAMLLSGSEDIAGFISTYGHDNLDELMSGFLPEDTNLLTLEMVESLARTGGATLGASVFMLVFLILNVYGCVKSCKENAKGSMTNRSKRLYSVSTFDDLEVQGETKDQNSDDEEEKVEEKDAKEPTDFFSNQRKKKIKDTFDDDQTSGEENPNQERKLLDFGK